MDQESIVKLKKELEAEKKSIRSELEGFAKKDKNIKYDWDARYPIHPDSNLEEEADETQEYDNLISLEQNLELRLKDIETALEKIKKGKYGKCEKCRKKIEEKRLLVYPEARLCITCNKDK